MSDFYKKSRIQGTSNGLSGNSRPSPTSGRVGGSDSEGLQYEGAGNSGRGIRELNSLTPSPEGRGGPETEREATDSV